MGNHDNKVPPQSNIVYAFILNDLKYLPCVSNEIDVAPELSILIGIESFRTHDIELKIRKTVAGVSFEIFSNLKCY